MKKLVIYSTIAAAMGLILTLVPVSLVTFTLTETRQYDAAQGDFLSEGSDKFGGNYGLEAQKYSVNDIAILAISFIIASLAYVLFKFRILH